MRRQLTSKISIVAASALTLGTCLPAGLAFADPADPPSVGEQSGAGSTAMTMVWDNPTQEYGGTEDPNNPMEITDPDAPGYDPTAPGANLAFKAPTAINFVAKASGELLAPSAGAVHIDNYSAYGIRVSSMKIDPNTTDGWNIVEDATAAAGTANAVWGTIGPDVDPLNWAGYVPVAPSTDPIPVTSPAAWNMAAYDDAASNNDQVVLATSGNVANLNLDLSTAKTFGTIHWYLKAGNAEGTPATPDVTVKDGFKGNVVTTMSMSQLMADASAVAADADWAVHADAANNYANPDASTVTGRYASYMMGDYSFSFAGDANSEPMEYRIIGLNHSPSDGETGITFMAKRSLDKAYLMREFIDVQNSWGADEYTWRDTALRKELNPNVDNGQAPGSGQVYALIPQLVRDNASAVSKTSSMQGDNPSSDRAVTNDPIWLISPGEVWGDDIYEEFDLSTNKQYAFFDANNLTRSSDPSLLANIAQSMSGPLITDGVAPGVEHAEIDAYGVRHIWTRSLFTMEFQMFTLIDNSGDYGRSYAHDTKGVAPCFNLH